ncbi:hypothetical protein C7431_104541 [Pantoea allii]|uniref:Uncharacterized protein n=1 Tax=Pantoea allii TaxID=574096 RepID=A0A2V2BIW1_9GAMM|nr:hypothetical protein [Pantoea allii]PWK97845.1 hypothetical protein C7431_104541 [Pantoea allii]
MSTYLQIAATFIGLIGTLLMFFNSYSLLPYESAMMGSDEIIENDRLTRTKNHKMLVRQKIGIGLLTFSFLLQLVSYAL